MMGVLDDWTYYCDEVYPVVKQWWLDGLIKGVKMSKNDLIDDDQITPLDQHIAVLMGFSTTEDMRDEFTADNVTTWRALAGPHGYVIYQMLRVRNGKTTET